MAAAIVVDVVECRELGRFVEIEDDGSGSRFRGILETLEYGSPARTGEEGLYTRTVSTLQHARAKEHTRSLFPVTSMPPPTSNLTSALAKYAPAHMPRKRPPCSTYSLIL